MVPASENDREGTRTKEKARNQNGLVGAWAFDDGAGGWANDTSGNGNNGTLTNMAPGTCWVEGINGTALAFDGVDDYVACGNDASLNWGGADYTISAWVKRESFGAFHTIVGKQEASGNYRGWYLRFDPDDRLTFAVGNYDR